MTEQEQKASTLTTFVEVDPAKVINAMLELEFIAPPNEWVLVAPDGRVWRQKPQELLQVLMPYHPLLQMPSFKDLL